MLHRDMSKTRNPKKPDQKYFDLRHVSEVDDIGAPYEPFIHAYGGYVLLRSKVFSNKFEEMRNIQVTSNEKKTIALLKKAQQLIEIG